MVIVTEIFSGDHVCSEYRKMLHWQIKIHAVETAHELPGSPGG